MCLFLLRDQKMIIILYSGFYRDNNIRTEFCMKTFQTTSSFDSNWPPGAYCILQYGGSCPYGNLLVVSNHFAYFSFRYSVIFRININKCENQKNDRCVCARVQSRLAVLG